MADNKGVQDTAKKTPSSKAADLLASGRPAPRARQESRVNQYLMILILIGIVVALGMIFLRKKPAAAAAAKSAVGTATRRAKRTAGDVAKSEGGKPASASARSARKPARRGDAGGQSRVASGASSSREARRRERAARLEAKRSRRGTRGSGDRATRAARRQRDKFAKRGKVESAAVTGISGPGDNRSALIGGRSFRVGDVVRGRIIREIGDDYIRVEYGGVNSNLRIGDKLP